MKDLRSEPSPGASYYEWLSWHFHRGTRPIGDRKNAWTFRTLASKIHRDDRTIRNWIAGRNFPDPASHELLLEALFGKDTDGNKWYETWYEILDKAYRSHSKGRAASKKAGRLAKALPSQSELDGRTTRPNAVGGRSATDIENALPPQAARPKNDGDPLLSPSLVSNVETYVPKHFLGRETELAAIRRGLTTSHANAGMGTPAVALHGLRGVGKTILAAAYAQRHAKDYRATWWISAGEHADIGSGLAGLGVRLGWVTSGVANDVAVREVLSRLRHDGSRILLIFDNAVDAESVQAAFPSVGETHVLITSNAHTFRALAELIEIRPWPPAVGADFLVSRTGRTTEHAQAASLSEELGGLPLAHEHAAAYCEVLEVSIQEYEQRFAARPLEALDLVKYAPAQYYDKRTVAKTFALAMDAIADPNAANYHPAADLLISYAALLAPEPIPLFLFAENRGRFGDPLDGLLGGDGLAEAVASLRSYALVFRESITDDRNPARSFDCIRLHRLVREVAIGRCSRAARSEIARKWIEVLESAYPESIFEPSSWPVAQRLDAHIVALIDVDIELSPELEGRTSGLLDRVATYRQLVVGAFEAARQLFERVVLIRERVFGPDDPKTGVALNNLGLVLERMGRTQEAQRALERAVQIDEVVLKRKGLAAPQKLSNLGFICLNQGKYRQAGDLFRRALAIDEEFFGPFHVQTAGDLNNLALAHRYTGAYSEAQRLMERAVAINQRLLGDDHPRTAASFGNLAEIYRVQGRASDARQLFERALAIYERHYGSDHIELANFLNNFSLLAHSEGDLPTARALSMRALGIREKFLGPDHSDVAMSVSVLALIAEAEGNFDETKSLYERLLELDEKGLGFDHPEVAITLRNYGLFLCDQGDAEAARPLLERAHTICKTAFGPTHYRTAEIAEDLTKLDRAEQGNGE